MFGTVDAWLSYKLTGEAATDPSNASRTMLFDLAERRLGRRAARAVRHPRAALPAVVPSCGELGDDTAPTRCTGTPSAGRDRRRPAGRAVRPGLRRSRPRQEHLRHRLVRAAERRATSRPTGGGAARHGRVGDRRAPRAYALEASIFVTGAAVQWLRDGLGIIEAAAETEALAPRSQGNDGVYFVPALTGLGSPHWDPYARGTIVGLTRGASRAHLARAALESIAYQTVDAVRAMEAASGVELTELRADGGATVNGWLMQFQADVLGCPVRGAGDRRDDRARRRLPGRRRDRAVDDRRGRPHLAREQPLRAADEPATSVRRCSRELAPRARAQPRLGPRHEPRSSRCRAQAAGLHRPPARRSTSTSSTSACARGEPAPGSTRWCARSRSCTRSLAFRRAGYGTEQRPERPGDPGAESRLVHGPLLHRRVRAPPGAVHGQVADVQRASAAGSSATAACSRSAAGSTTRRRSRPRSRSSSAAAPVVMYCEGGRSRTGRARRAGQARASAGWRWSPVCRSCRWRSSAPTRCATGSGFSFPRVTVVFGSPFRLERDPESRDREQQQAAADLIFDRIRVLFSELQQAGHAQAREVARRA